MITRSETQLAGDHDSNVSELDDVILPTRAMLPSAEGGVDAVILPGDHFSVAETEIRRVETGAQRTVITLIVGNSNGRMESNDPDGAPQMLAFSYSFSPNEARALAAKLLASANEIEKPN